MADPLSTFVSSFISPDRSIVGQNSGELVRVDASLREEHLSELEMAENPIQFGADITDHAFLLPLQLTLTAGVSNTPIDPNPSIFTSVPWNRASAAYEQLQRFQGASPNQLQGEAPIQLLQIQTGLRLYRNMLLVSLTTAQDVDTEKVLLFTAVFREAILVDTLAIGNPKDIFPEGDTQNRRTSDVERGNIGTPNQNTEGNSPEAVQNRSILKGIVSG